MRVSRAEKVPPHGRLSFGKTNVGNPRRGDFLSENIILGIPSGKKPECVADKRVFQPPVGFM